VILVTGFDRKAPIRTVLTTTALTNVYTCETGMVASLAAIRLVNTDLTLAANVTVTITDGASVSYTVYPTNSLAAKTVLELDFSGHPLFAATDSLAAEKVWVQASVANIIHVVGTVLELG
jgi:hypothetical protein